MKKRNLIYLLTILLLSQLKTVHGQDIDQNYFYRLTTSWQGDGKSLEAVYAGQGNQVELAPSDNASRQFWRFISVGSGYYRIVNQWQNTKSIDIINDGKNNRPWLDKTAELSGQYWKLTPLNGGFFRLTCAWQGEGKSLDVVNDGTNNKVSLTNSGPYSGQYWKLTKMEIVNAENTKPPTGHVHVDNGFSMILTSDSQWPWTSKTDAGVAEPDNEKEENATVLNQNHVSSINSLVASLGNVKGLIMNGDLTAYGHSRELDKFKSIYAGIKVPMYLGLGNHDYANNVDNCYENNCANRMVEYMVDHIKTNGSTSSDVNVSDAYKFPEIVTTTTGSLSYSWDVGNIHFVQLQNFPVYQREWSNYVSDGAAKRKTVKITAALNWLGADLAKARSAGKIIILNYHDSDEHWSDYGIPQTLTSKFTQMLSTYNVAAVFVGHYHSSIGRDYPTRVSYGTVPVFYCGSASQSKFMLVNFKGNKMTVENVSSLNAETTRSNRREYTLFDRAETIPPPKQDGWVTFFNESGYVAKYTMTYTLNGQVQTFNSGNLAVGNKVRYEIPADATKVTVKGEGKTGLVWEPWRLTFYFEYNEVIQKCFKSYNTSLNQLWNNNCE